jgi:integrase
MAGLFGVIRRRDRGLCVDLLSLSASALIRAVEHHRRPARPRPLLLLGFASALRRSELVGLDAAPGQTPGDPAGHGWIEFCDEGIRIRLARSKTDQQGEGRSIGVPFGVHPDTCPVAAVKAWLDHADIVHGPLFPPVGRAGTLRLDRLSDRSVALIVKRAAEAAGLGPTGYAGHSLRSGHATKVAMNDGDERTIQAQLGHASTEMTRRYIREANIFRRSSAGKLGL